MANPFEEQKPRVSEYTAQEIATLQSRLDKQLGPEYISSRPGASGQKVHYLAAEKCINLANEVFGFNGWSSSIQTIQIDFVDESQSTGKISLGLSVIVRVTLRDGTYHEDIGYGHIENCKGKAAAFEKAKKEGTTDALKRALRNFGNVLGNCIYDKDYLAKVTKVKVNPSRWDADNLHRHPDYAPVKKEHTGQESNGIKKEEVSSHASTLAPDGEDEFGGDVFSELDFGGSYENGLTNPDEVMLDASASSDQRFDPRMPRKPIDASTGLPKASVRTGKTFQHPMAMPSALTPRPEENIGANQQTHMHRPPQNSRSVVSAVTPVHNSESPSISRQSQVNPLQQHPVAIQTRSGSGSAGPASPSKQERANTNDETHFRTAGGHEPPVGFFTARAAESMKDPGATPSETSRFNVRLESPSIRRTSGVDHNVSRPVSRGLVPASPSGNVVSPVVKTNFLQPQMDNMRRIGAPSSGVPAQNRGQYKPPGPAPPKRISDNSNPLQTRAPLGVLPSVQLNIPPERGEDSKRVKLADG